MSATKEKTVAPEGCVVITTSTYRIYLYPKRKRMQRVPLDHEGFSEDKLLFFAEEPYTHLVHFDGGIEVISPVGRFRGML